MMDETKAVEFTPIKRQCSDQCDYPKCEQTTCVLKMVSPEDIKLAIRTHIQDRIAQLRQADAEFCLIRWDKTKSAMEKFSARDWSNEVTARRQELEEVLNFIKKT